MADRRWVLHEVMVEPDWTVRTPHDLPAERVAAAFGGHLSCLSLEGNCIAAVRTGLELALRHHVPPVTRRGPSWVSKRPQTCCRRTMFATLTEAVTHLRSADHLAAELGAEPRLVEPLLRAVLVAHGAREHAALREGPWMPLPESQAAALVQEERGLLELWEAGVHPHQVELIHRELGVPEPLPASFYLGAVLTRARVSAMAHAVRTVGDNQDDGVERDGLSALLRSRPSARPPDLSRPLLAASRFTPAAVTDEPFVTWLAWTWTDADEQDSESRLAWVTLGVPRRAVVDLLLSPYTPEDALALAASTRVSAGTCAEVLATWWSRGWQPDVADLASLVRLGLQLTATPPAKAVELFVRTVVSAGVQPPDSTESALLVAACGAARTAAHAWIRADPDWRGAGWVPPTELANHNGTRSTSTTRKERR